MELIRSLPQELETLIFSFLSDRLYLVKTELLERTVEWKDHLDWNTPAPRWVNTWVDMHDERDWAWFSGKVYLSPYVLAIEINEEHRRYARLR